LELRGIQVRELTAKQFIGWEHFAEIEPFTLDIELRADIRAAQIAQVIANVNRGKGQKAYTIKDFLVQFDGEAQQPERKKTWQEMQQIAYMIASAYNAPGVTS
jgi:hypothetical protein